MSEQLTIRVSLSRPLPTDEILEKPPFDKRKVSLAVLLAATGIYACFAFYSSSQVDSVKAITAEPIIAKPVKPVTAETVVVKAPKPAITNPVKEKLVVVASVAYSGASEPDTALHESVSRMILTSGIAKHEPVDTLRDIKLEQGDASRRIYFFTELNDIPGQNVYHRWTYQGQSVAELNLPVRAERWRTYSSKRITADRLGQWSIEVLDQQRQLLAAYAFEVK